ncbi:unknown [Firmicutes bacterium CAG:449]|nr:unknown [Firmicutes bacterium CAG:449]
MLTLHRELLDQLTSAYGNGYNAVGYLFLIFIGMNFLIEFVINVALVPTTYKLTNLLLNK